MTIILSSSGPACWSTTLIAFPSASFTYMLVGRYSVQLTAISFRVFLLQLLSDAQMSEPKTPQEPQNSATRAPKIPPQGHRNSATRAHQFLHKGPAIPPQGPNNSATRAYRNYAEGPSLFNCCICGFQDHQSWASTCGQTHRILLQSKIEIAGCIVVTPE